MSARFTRRSSSTPVRVEPAHGYRLAALLGATALLAALAGIALATDRSLSPLTWYIARASGVALYLLLWGTVALGLGRGRCRLGPWAGELGLDNVVITKPDYCIFRFDKKGEGH